MFGIALTLSYACAGLHQILTFAARKPNVLSQPHPVGPQGINESEEKPKPLRQTCDAGWSPIAAIRNKVAPAPGPITIPSKF